MAEQFLTLMADLDGQAQARMRGWQDQLEKQGFCGTQTPGLPYHISLATFALEQEAEARAEMLRLAAAFDPLPVHISHIGIFPGGRVLFGAPDMDPPALKQLHDAIRLPAIDRFPWTPHATLLIDSPQEICRAVPALVRVFQPFTASITRLHLCAFWPTREIGSAELGRR